MFYCEWYDDNDSSHNEELQAETPEDLASQVERTIGGLTSDGLSVGEAVKTACRNCTFGSAIDCPNGRLYVNEGA